MVGAVANNIFQPDNCALLLHSFATVRNVRYTTKPMATCNWITMFIAWRSQSKQFYYYTYSKMLSINQLLS